MTCEWCHGEIVAKDPERPGRQRKFCSDYCRKRAHEDGRRAVCHCGATMGAGSAYPRGAKQCRACTYAERAVAREAHVQEVARLYNLGLPIREIAVALGWNENTRPHSLTEAHRRGLIGYRYRAYEKGSS